ncbi:hypothetical protein ACP4OV_021436 [Aristida adscensionis]
MAPPDEPSDGGRVKRAMETHSIETVQFLILAKLALGDDAYDELTQAVKEIAKLSANPDGGITVGKCEEILSEVFTGQTRLLKFFRHFLEVRDPFHEDRPLHVVDPISFVAEVKACPYISDDDYNALLVTMFQLLTETITVEEVYPKAKKLLRQCPEFLEVFKSYLPPELLEPLPAEQSCRSPKTNPILKEFLSLTPDANHSSASSRVKGSSSKNKVSQHKYPHRHNHESTGHNFKQNQTHMIPDSIQIRRRGSGESLHAEEDEGDKIDPLPEWSPSRENELPPKVDLTICLPCTPSYCLLPENCITLQSSYQTELGRSIFNDTLVSFPSGSEDCFKFRTKNHYEENIFKCEDDMFESDMLLQRFRTTADFIGNLQDLVDSDTKIPEHLSSIHRRCIEQLYDDYGPDMLDALSETQNTSAALAVLQQRLNQKIEELSEAQISLNKTCSNIIASNYSRSLDHCSSSFKQSDKKRMSQKELLAEAKQINMTELNNVDKHFFPWKKQPRLIFNGVPNDTDLHIHEDIDSFISYASSRSCTSEHKPMLIWSKLVKPFVSANCHLQELDGTVVLKEACESCGLGKDLLSNIPSALVANNFPLSSKRDGCPVNTSNRSTSIHYGCDVEIEEGEYIPDSGNNQLDGSCDVAPSAEGSSFRYTGPILCKNNNKYEEQHGSRESSNDEIGSSAYSQKIAEVHDVKGSIPCCSLVVLCRLHQILYERLEIAKDLSRAKDVKAFPQRSGTGDLFTEFKRKLFSLLDGSIDNTNFEEYCLRFLGPKSYVLFTIDKLIQRVVKQLCKICVADEDNSLQRHDRGGTPKLSKELLHHENARGSPARMAKGLLEQDREYRENGSKLLSDAGKPRQNQFQRRKKRKLAHAASSLSQSGVHKSDS